MSRLVNKSNFKVNKGITNNTFLFNEKRSRVSQVSSTNKDKSLFCEKCKSLIENSDSDIKGKEGLNDDNKNNDGKKEGALIKQSNSPSKFTFNSSSKGSGMDNLHSINSGSVLKEEVKTNNINTTEKERKLNCSIDKNEEDKIFYDSAVKDNNENNPTPHFYTTKEANREIRNYHEIYKKESSRETSEDMYKNLKVIEEENWQSEEENRFKLNSEDKKRVFVKNKEVEKGKREKSVYNMLKNNIYDSNDQLEIREDPIPNIYADNKENYEETQTDNIINKTNDEKEKENDILITETEERNQDIQDKELSLKEKNNSIDSQNQLDQKNKKPFKVLNSGSSNISLKNGKDKLLPSSLKESFVNSKIKDMLLSKINNSDLQKNKIKTTIGVSIEKEKQNNTNRENYIKVVMAEIKNDDYLKAKEERSNEDKNLLNSSKLSSMDKINSHRKMGKNKSFCVSSQLETKSPSKNKHKETLQIKRCDSLVVSRKKRESLMNKRNRSNNSKKSLFKQNNDNKEKRALKEMAEKVDIISSEILNIKNKVAEKIRDINQNEETPSYNTKDIEVNVPLDEDAFSSIVEITKRTSKLTNKDFCSPKNEYNAYKRDLESKRSKQSKNKIQKIRVFENKASNFHIKRSEKKLTCSHASKEYQKSEGRCHKIDKKVFKPQKNKNNYYKLYLKNKNLKKEVKMFSMSRSPKNKRKPKKVANKENEHYPCIVDKKILKIKQSDVFADKKFITNRKKENINPSYGSGHKRKINIYEKERSFDKNRNKAKRELVLKNSGDFEKSIEIN